jgi:pyruvate dehydrogenase E2 component (dihydrolipoamide acetyltransferase)
VTDTLSRPSPAGLTPLQLAPMPRIDHAAFGEVEVAPLSKIQRLTGAFLARNWASIPHVTHQDEADVTALETLRRSMAAGQPPQRVTALAFCVKAVARALREFPRFNASLDPDGEKLILKKYVHIGVAVDTPNGLLVPVIRNCDARGLPDIAADISAVSQRARAKGLPLAEMQGGCFTISSLGAQGGTGFTPIINAPEVAILGLSRLLDRPFRGPGDQVEWRKVLPLSLSYDHRVINGADAARFTTRLRELLTTPDALAA